MNRKKGAVRKKSVTNKAGKDNFEIKGIVFLAIGILSAFGIYTNFAGFLSNFLQRISYLLVGITCYALPLYILYLGYNYLRGRGTLNINKKFYGITLMVLVITLVVGTLYIQSMSNPREFGQNLNRIVSSSMNGNLELNGGVVAYFISYGLFVLIGGVGSYILYGTMFVISLIISFDISVIETMVQAKNKIIQNRKVQNKKAKQEEYFKQDKSDEFIKVIPKNKDVDGQTNNELLNDVNHKIKILDFMKNSNMADSENENELEREVAISNESGAKRTHFIDIVEPKEETKGKKEKLDSNIKEDVSDEINSKMNTMEEEIKAYIFPKTDLLNNNGKTKLNNTDKKELIDSANKLEEILGSFGVDAKVVQVTKGPSVTRFELQPSPGVKVSKIVNLADDIALGLAASGVRIEAPIPGKAAVGIEVPNKKQTAVFLREVLDSSEFQNSTNKLAFALGKDIGGISVVGDLSKMPHTLIAGATGSGKSVCINSLIISILYKYKPEEVRLLLVDPKVVELNVYNGIPHLLIPVVTDPKKAAAALNWAVNEMTKRYNLFAEKGVRNIDSYNGLLEKGLIQEKMPYIVIIVDELADLMMVCPNDVEDYIGRLAQMARAAGMHLVIATQRPSVDVITGVIKANIPSRISFAVSSQVDSRTILDSAGAEKLLGKGDMLYYPVGESKPQRVQGCFISEEEVESVVEFIKNDGKEVSYEEEILDHINKETEAAASNLENNSEVDELLPEAIKLVVEFDQASTSFLQRRFRVGFNRASRIMDQLEERGVISAKDGSRPRQVLIRKDEIDDEISSGKEI